MPELDFASLLAGRAILGIGQDLLRFSPHEIVELARVQGSRKLNEEEAEQLATAFDGWITGLLLGTQLGGVQFLQRGWSAPLPRKGQKMHTQTLFSYVVNEVFKRHEEVYAFLKEIVVLQEMTPTLCADLLDITAARVSQLLQYLERHGLFVTQTGEGAQPIYICHTVLRDLLYEELRLQNPERFVQLHQRAAEILSANQQYEQAIYHALEANVDEIAARLIIASAEQMIGQGHLEVLQQWIAAFSETTITRYPRLLLIRANISLRKSELGVAQPLLEQLTRLLNSQLSTLANPEELPLLQAELVIARANILSQQGEYQQVQQLCEQVLAHLPADEVTLRANAHISLGGCAHLRGDLNTAIGHYQKALQLWGRHTISRLTAGGHGSLSVCYCWLGHFALAEHHNARATACWEQLQNIGGIANHLIARARLAWDQGGLTEAEALLQQALEKASNPLRLHRLQGYVLVNLGDLSQDRGLYDRSLTQTEEGLALARQ
ncbi:MAG: tetratricopeptide repeat protein, partial [Ktedonobacteraceae bacterium]